MKASNSPQKVLIATPLYPPDSGGPAREAVSLERELPRRGMSVVVYSFGRVRKLPKVIRHLVYLIGLIGRIKGVDRIIAVDTFSVCLPAAVVSSIFRIPLVVRVPGDFAWEQAVQRFGVTDNIETFQRKRYGWKVELIRRLELWAVRRACLVVVHSEYFKKIISGWGIRPERIKRIYLGGPDSVEVITPDDVPDGHIIVSAGRMVPWKGFGDVIEALKDLDAAWSLVLIGDGPDKRRLEERARDEGVSDRVKFTGAIKHQEVLGWLKEADVFVLNTSFESFSFQVLEAMASGVPVISARAGSVPELVRDGVDGVLCAPGDRVAIVEAIRSVIADKGAWEKMTQSAVERSRQFSDERSADEFVMAMKEVCA